MNPVVLTPITKAVKIIDSEQAVILSDQRKNEIEDFWLKINCDGRFQRGEVFSVTDVVETGSFFEVLLKATDYAHYLHSVRNQITDSEGCKVIYGAALVETDDAKLVFGEMATHTAYPGRLQCIGGGLSNEDRNGDTFDIKKSVLRELSEEIGIDSETYIKSFKPLFIKKGGPFDFLVVLFHIQLNIDAAQLNGLYHLFIKELMERGETPEFQNIIYLNKDKNSIFDFIKNDHRESVDYLKPLFEKMIDEL